MTVRISHWRGVRSRGVLLALLATLIPAPVMASDAAQPTKGTSAQVSLHAAVAREAAKIAATASVARHDEQATSTTRGPGFFRTKAGMVALAVMAAGTGYAVYSAQHDRVKSPAKQ